MTKQNQIYKCEVCGNIVEVLHIGAGELVCCGQPMKLMEEKIKDEGKEKHLPVIEKSSIIKIGEVEHPMNENHFIEWIEITTENEKKLKKFLKFDDKPQFDFNIKERIISVRCYCNIHGLWKYDVEK